MKCRNPGNPEHGRLYGDTYSVDSQVTFSCEEGFQLMGAAKLTCMESGEWSHPIPYCEGVVPGENACWNVTLTLERWKGQSSSEEPLETMGACESLS